MREEFNDRKSQNVTEYIEYNTMLICLMMYSRLMHIDKG